MASSNCPLCGQVDAVMKVSSIVAGGTASYSMAGYSGSTRTQLAAKLQPPPKPASGNVTPCSVWFVFLLGVLFVCAWLFVAAGARPLQEGAGGPLSVASAIVGGLLIVGCVVFEISQVGARKLAAQARVSRYQGAMNKYNSLYYCHRDDCVFIPDEGRAVPLSQMNSLLSS